MATLDLGRVVGADGKSATLEITGVQNLPYGSDPVITEDVDSTPLARKYRLGIPAGKPGTNAGGGGAGIDDGSVATDTTYSSAKIEAIADRLSQQKADKTGWTANKIIGTDANGNLVVQDPPENNGGDANTLGGKEPKYYLQPRNLLDNSDFTNPVNQRGVTTHTGNGYSIDRWRAYHSDTIHRVTNEGVIVSSNSGINPNMYQPLENGVIKENQIYTAACCDVNGNVYIWSGIPSSETGGNVVVVYANSNSAFLFRISVGASGPQDIPLVWAALYEGEYTIDNLPPYIPKGYTSELLECQRYAFAPGSLFRLRPTQITPNLMDFSIAVPVLMRDVPSFTPSTLTLYGTNNDYIMTVISGVSFNIGEVGYAGIVLRATKNSHGFSGGLLDFEGTVFSADL